jgi:heat shock protein HslJ
MEGGMRSPALLALVAVMIVTSPALAQVRRKRGEDDGKSNPGYSDIKKKEEKRFPLGAAWIATSIDGKVYAGSERPSFALDDQFRVRGFGGCNSFTASAFPLREQGIAVGPLAITKKACDKSLMEAETKFLTALRTSAKWDTQVGSLIIKGPNGELRFERSL